MSLKKDFNPQKLPVISSFKPLCLPKLKAIFEVVFGIEIKLSQICTCFHFSIKTYRFTEKIIFNKARNIPFLVSGVSRILSTFLQK